MEQVILDHLYFEVRKKGRLGDDSDSKNLKRIVLDSWKLNDLISLFGKYPNFVFIERGIKSNHSGYIVKYYGVYGVYDDYEEELKKNFSTYVNNALIGITASYLDNQNEPFSKIIYRKSEIVNEKTLFPTNIK